MKTLMEAVAAHAGGQAKALVKHLNDCGLNDWADLTRAGLNDLRDYMAERLAASSARTYLAVLKCILSRYEDETGICRDFRTILRVRNEKPVKTFLGVKELERLKAVPVRSEAERLVLDEFMIGAYTGMRISDVVNVSEENMAEGYLGYVSEKTGVHAVVPCSLEVAERIRRVRANDLRMSLAGYNKVIRRLCRRAGITERVKVYRAGETVTGEKWEFVSSHTARISFCTNLSLLGVPLLDVSRMAGHTSTGMTERYVVPTRARVSERAMKYFR